MKLTGSNVLIRRPSFFRPLNPASHAPNPRYKPREIVIERENKGGGAARGNWVRARRINPHPDLQRCFFSLIRFAEPRLTSSGHGDEAGEDEEDKGEAHGGFGVVDVEAGESESEKRWDEEIEKVPNFFRERERVCETTSHLFFLCFSTFFFFSRVELICHSEGTGL